MEAVDSSSDDSAHEKNKFIQGDYDRWPIHEREGKKEIYGIQSQINIFNGDHQAIKDLPELKIYGKKNIDEIYD